MYRSPSLICWILALLGLAMAVNATSRGSYPRCTRTGRKTGMAHYRGWKIIGDDVSGGLPISPERSCIQTCTKYGSPCNGVSYSDTLSMCYLKGDDHEKWTFKRSMNRDDGVDLIGGCAAWANIVPADMDATCCRG